MNRRIFSTVPALRAVAEGEPATVLVVEDEASSRELLVELLQDEGYRVLAAAGAWEALGAVARQPPDIVISDVCMSGGDGLSLLQALREGAHGRTPVIMVSAMNDIDRRVNALDLGADDFVSKPIVLEELLARVRSHLRRSLRESELASASYIDELTGLPNRRALVEFFEREQRCAEQEGQTLSLAMIDLNGFKALNDHHGHVVGDQALRRVGRFLLENVRATDCVGRLGGDEFLVVLCEAGEVDAVELAERLRSRLPVEVALEGGAALQVDLAVGVAAARPGEGLDAALPRADERMYRNKRRRNRPA
jgi:diguanylate cyclase (GGDEF)-like protein